MQSPPARPRWPQRATVAAVALRGRHLLVLDILAVIASYVRSFALRFDAPSLVRGRDVRIVHTGLGMGRSSTKSLFFPHERPDKTVHDSIWVAAGHAEARPPVDLGALQARVSAGDIEAS